jgi:hypothetical protein
MTNDNDRTQRRGPYGPDDEDRSFVEKIRPLVSLIGQCVRWAIELLDALGRFK